MFLCSYLLLKSEVETWKQINDRFALKFGDKGLSDGHISATDYKSMPISRRQGPGALEISTDVLNILT